MPRKKKTKEEVYHVEVITKARVSEDGEWEYHVKWAGYDSDADSWEPSENVQQCNRLLASFWKHVGMDDNDYPIGYEVVAEESWIDKEKLYFADTFVKPSKRKSDKTTKNERRKSRSSVSEESTVNDSQSSDDEPVVKPPTIKKKFNKRPRAIETESDSESDGPLHEQATAHLKATTPPSLEHLKAPPAVKRPGTSSTTSGSLPLAPPKVPVKRTHQDQRTNPLVKSITIPSQSVEAGSSLSTKQRVAAGIRPPPTGPKPLPLAPKKSLPALSFKKNKPPILPSQTKDTTGPNASVATPTSPTALPKNIVDDVGHSDVAADVVASPEPMDIDQPLDLFGPASDDVGPRDRSPEIIAAPIPPKSQEEISAEEFLQSINIPALNDPLEMDVISDPPIQPTTELHKAPTVSKIPKKWKWSGDLFVNTSESKAELLCTVSIADPSGTSNSSHINLLLSHLDSLRVEKLYLFTELSPLLRACGKPQYFGKLESNESSEEMLINGLRQHLMNDGLVAAIPLLLDGAEVALLLVFPNVQQGLIKVLQVPEHLLSGTPLLVVLLPFLVSAMASTKSVGHRSIQAVQQSLINSQDVLEPHDFSQEVMLHQAMSLLGLPKALLDFIKSSPTGRRYCIWPAPDELSPGLDTAMLQYILKSIKAISVKLEEDVRVIFTPNSHLGMLPTMPSLVTKKANSPEIQFWTYGCTADVTCKRWRAQEIYPLGGIVTFTSSAIVEDLIGCQKLISQVVEHPLWDCYLLPEALAVSHLLFNNGESSASSESCLDPILDLINLGSISVVKMPEKSHSDQVSWLSEVLHPFSANRHELLDIYLGVLKNQCTTSDMTVEQLITLTNNVVIKNLSSAQIQPALMQSYRRFVVIKATSEDVTLFDKHGLEWSLLSKFSFKDDFFQS